MAQSDSLYVTPTAGTTASTQQTPVPQALPASSALTQVSGVLGAILLLILCIAWLVKRAGLAPQARNNKQLKVTASCQVGRGEKVVIVEVDNTCLVLGVTAHQITPLHQFAAPLVDEHAVETDAQAKPVDFAQLLQKIVKRPGK